jgi:hypothetical protein
MCTIKSLNDISICSKEITIVKPFLYKGSPIIFHDKLLFILKNRDFNIVIMREDRGLCLRIIDSIISVPTIQDINICVM